MSTFVAIILGTITGTAMVAKWKQEPIFIGVFLIAIAVLGTLTSLRIAHPPAPATQRPFSWNPLGDILRGVRRLTNDRGLALTVVGTTFFWFLGALLQMLLLLFAQETLHCRETEIGLLLMSLAIGIGVGSVAAGAFPATKSNRAWFLSGQREWHSPPWPWHLSSTAWLQPWWC